MGASKNQFPNIFNWQTTAPYPFQQNAQPSGVTAGVMTGTSTIYSNIVKFSTYDNYGLRVDWTGTPVGTFQVMYSNNGLTFNPLVFSPSLAQPNGSPGGYGIDINQFPFTYLMLQYTNTSGSGTITVNGQGKAFS